MIKAVIFDMDGVIIDSEPVWFKVDQIMIKKFGKPCNIEYKNKIMGLNGRGGIKLLRKLFKLKGTTKALLKIRFSLLKNLLKKEVKTRPGAEKLIINLYKKHYPLALASSSPPDVISLVLKKFNLKKYFKVIISGHRIRKIKPHPDIFLKTAKKLKIKPKNCLVIEDAPSGEKAAKRAGMKCIIVRHKYNQDIKFKLADLVVKSLKNINLKIIKQLN